MPPTLRSGPRRTAFASIRGSSRVRSRALAVTDRIETSPPATPSCMRWSAPWPSRPVTARGRSSKGLPQASLGAAYLAFLGTLAALYRRSYDGCGRHVDTSLLDGALAYHSMLWSESDASVAAMAAQGVGQNSTAGTRLITRSFVCSDGQYIGIHTGAVGAFGRLMKVLELDDRIPPSASGLDMGAPLAPEQIALLETELHRRIAAEPRAHWVAVLRQAEVCAIEHLLPCEVFDQPQARHNEMVVEIDDPVLGLVQQVAPAAKFPSLGAVDLTPAPTPGQHTGTVLAEGWDGEPFDGQVDGRGAGTASASADRQAEIRRKPFRAARGRQDSRSRRIFRRAVLVAPSGRPRSRRHQARTHPGRPATGDRSMLLPGAGRESDQLPWTSRHPGAQPIVEALLDWADVVHHNLRPGAAERLGLAYDDIRQCPSRPGLPLRPRVGVERSRHAPAELCADDVRLRRRHVRGRRAIQRTPPDAVQRGSGQRDAGCRLHRDGAAASAPDRTRDVHREPATECHDVPCGAHRAACGPRRQRGRGLGRRAARHAAIRIRTVRTALSNGRRMDLHRRPRG